MIDHNDKLTSEELKILTCPSKDEIIEKYEKRLAKLERQTMSTTNTTLTDETIQAEWNTACKASQQSPGWNRHIRFARAIEQLVAQEVRRQALEDAAKVCDLHSAMQWGLYKRGDIGSRERGNPYVEGRSDGADYCAERIRALANADPVQVHVLDEQKRKRGRPRIHPAKEVFKQKGFSVTVPTKDGCIAYINVTKRKLEWACNPCDIKWDTPQISDVPKIPLYADPVHPDQKEKE